MTMPISLRLLSAAFVVLAPPDFTPVASRCAARDARDPTADGKAVARVLAAEVRARLLVFRDPEETYQLLKRLRDEVVTDPEISEPWREWMALRLESAMRGVLERGIVLKQRETGWGVFRSAARDRIERLRVELARLRARLSP